MGCEAAGIFVIQKPSVIISARSSATFIETFSWF